MQCSICLDEIEVGPGGWSEGHNAQPVAEGRCCRVCNDTIVIPARLSMVFGVLKEKEGSK